MKYLVIDRTMVQPIRGVVESGGASAGSTLMLDQHEVQACAKWLGVHGGRDLLDAFEVQLINDGAIEVFPVDVDGLPLHDECEAQEIIRYDDGPRIAWVPRVRCDVCCGQGHFNLHGEPVDEDDICPNCDGHGQVSGREFETDMDGAAVKAAQ